MSGNFKKNCSYLIQNISPGNYLYEKCVGLDSVDSDANNTISTQDSAQASFFKDNGIYNSTNIFIIVCYNINTYNILAAWNNANYVLSSQSNNSSDIVGVLEVDQNQVGQSNQYKFYEYCNNTVVDFYPDIPCSGNNEVSLVRAVSAVMTVLFIMETHKMYSEEKNSVV